MYAKNDILEEKTYLSFATPKLTEELNYALPVSHFQKKLH